MSTELDLELATKLLHCSMDALRIPVVMLERFQICSKPPPAATKPPLMRSIEGQASGSRIPKSATSQRLPSSRIRSYPPLSRFLPTQSVGRCHGWARETAHARYHGS